MKELEWNVFRTAIYRVFIKIIYKYFTYPHSAVFTIILQFLTRIKTMEIKDLW